MTANPLAIAMLCIHSSPIGALGAQNTGGMSIVVRETARALGARGHTVDIYTAASDNRLQRLISLYPNVRLIHLDGNQRVHIPKAEIFDYLPHYYAALENFIQASDRTYDLLHSHYWLSGRLGLWAQENWDLPHVITYHTLGQLKIDQGPLENEPARRIRWERRLAESCDRLIVATPREKKNLLALSQVDPLRIGVVPFGVDPTAFDIQRPSEARTRVGLDVNDAVILFVGRFVSIKGLERLIQAVSLIDDPANPRLVLIGGDGPDAASTRQLKNLADQLDMHDRVTFKGRIDHAELNTYYNAADVLALCSYYESFGLVVMEALACGTPVVGTPVGFVDTIVKKGLNGVIVEDQTPQAIAAALAQVLRRRRAGKLPAAPIRTSVMEFTWSQVTTALYDQYVEAMNAKHLDTRQEQNEFNPR